MRSQLSKASAKKKESNKSAINKRITKNNLVRKHQNLKKAFESGASSNTYNESNIHQAESSKTISSKDAQKKKIKNEQKTKKKLLKSNLKESSDGRKSKTKSKKVKTPTSKKTSIKIKNTDEVKYKLNKVVNKPSIKVSKANLGTKYINDKKKTKLKPSTHSVKKNLSDDLPETNKISVDTSSSNISKNTESLSQNDNESRSSSSTSTNQASGSKTETERTHKFFTTSRAFSKTPKFLGKQSNLQSSVSNKNNSTNFICQGDDTDVYAFSEKVDSPKTNLANFRSSEKAIGRVRPIARVKGTVITKKTEEKRKFSSPHRPIEEVIKQLKANNRSEEIIQSSDSDSIKSKQIVSKSYKMVARKKIPVEIISNEKNNKSKSDTKNKNKPRSRKKLKQQYTSSEASDSNDETGTKETSESDVPKKKIIITSKLSKKIKKIPQSTDRKRNKKSAPPKVVAKKHRMASLNALAKVHCLYENESRTHVELGLMKTIDTIQSSGDNKQTVKSNESKLKKIDKQSITSESDYERMFKKSETSEDESIPTRSLRGVPGIRSAGKYWDPKSCSSSDDSELEYVKRISALEVQNIACTNKTSKSEPDKSVDKKKNTRAPVKKRRNRNEVVMDLKDMVVQKRMASLNATAILAASYEKRPHKSRDDTTSDSCSDESSSSTAKNLKVAVKSERKSDQNTETEDSQINEKKQKVEVIVNQDTDVTITGVYSTHHHEGFCTVSGMQYRISSTSHTQTTATSKCENESCSRDDGNMYTPLTALSSMQPPLEHSHGSQPVNELDGLSRRGAGCSSAFSAPSPASSQQDSAYYQPAGPLIKESGNEEGRHIARYHPQPPHYHNQHGPVLQQYYYPSEFCYGRFYRPAAGPYHMPSTPTQPDAQMVGMGNEPYPPHQFYGAPPCYQHPPPRVPYLEYRGCPCPINACPKNVLIGPATGNAPASGGPADVNSIIAQPGGTFRGKVRVACSVDTVDSHGSGKDPPLEPEPAADAPRPCHLPPALGGASPKRDRPSSVDVIGPPSPARGSAGACAPQPPPIAPRRPRLGKDMARRSLAGDDTGTLISPVNTPPSTNNHTKLSTSNEETNALTTTASLPFPVDLSHNATTVDVIEAKPEKTLKRRYSKLEVDLKDVAESCRSNGISDHVKLQKRKKLSTEQIENSVNVNATPEIVPKVKSPLKLKNNTVDKVLSPKRKTLQAFTDKLIKTESVDTIKAEPKPLTEKLNNVDETKSTAIKPKNKSAFLLDNLIRKNVELKITEKVNSEKVGKLLPSKKPAIKNDDATLLVEEACASPVDSLKKDPVRLIGSPSSRVINPDDGHPMSLKLVGQTPIKYREKPKGKKGKGGRRRRIPALLPPENCADELAPKWNNGWNWNGEPYVAKVYINNDSRLDRVARCWPSITHESGDSITRGDCVLLRATPAKAMPFVAKVAHLWQNPDDGEMMMSLVWYYRPEHTESGRQEDDNRDEVFASKHRDANSVACIEDKCYVLTFNEYCRYRKRLKMIEEGIISPPSIVPPFPANDLTPAIMTADAKLPKTIAPELILFCRKIYDFRSKKILAPNK